MIFKKDNFSSLFFFAILLYLQSCESVKTDNTNLEGKLSTNMVSNPRSLEPNDNLTLNSLGHLQFKDSIHDFGIIKEGENVMTEFEFTNTGKKGIFITEAKASCGCTKPEFPNELIQPNQKGMIKVTFNSEGKIGFNNKSIIITTNGNPSQYVLFIKNEVIK